MTTKTLGQVLYDEAIGNHERLRLLAPWTAFDESDRAEYERMAQAVAAVVREQCAQACEAERLVDPCKGEDEVYERAIEHCVAAIRSMK